MIAGSFLVDAHVHFHSCFDPTRFFDRAAANFRAAAATQGIADYRLGCLMFSEARGANFFAEFRDRGRAGSWRLTPTAEAGALLAQRDGGPELLLVAGRQIETAEKLEVLALATTAVIDDGRPLAATVAAVRAAGAIAVIPWCFGKWMLKRGAILNAFLREAPSGLYLGDNGRRLACSRLPSQFRLGAQRGLLLLPGSDPLPMPYHVGQAGTYGFALHGRIDWATPATALQQLIGRQTAQPALFGRLERVLPFCRDQLFMQLRKRGLRSWP